ncbi:MAG TPA: electron transfer flavoprotein subunit alpha/FixB family protein [Ilumatobacteraceae bacterium]|nr:electron transfer flavoprotein subunit alpha/FixB family protein [Ilumatobacteraceae bacterium]
MILVIVEHDRGTMSPATWEALAAARDLGETHALTIGAAADALVEQIGVFGATTVHQVHDDVLGDYGPEAWGDVVAQAVTALDPSLVLATGTDRGNEVMAHAAARLDVPMVANVIEFAERELVRVRWGGSLLERCTLDAPVQLVTIAHHAFAATESPVTPEALPLVVNLDPVLGRTVVRDRVERAAGVTLATAPVVVSGGRGVGSADGFAPLLELASELGGVVGCSRAVTNLGWRNHTDQVGQTGTRIAPDIYIACGISGAIQHWVGAMASKKILAINTDPEANMVTKADYAVIGDLHQVVPAITAEVRRRRGGG